MSEDDDAYFVQPISSKRFMICIEIIVAELQPDNDTPGLWIGFKTMEDREHAMRLFKVEN